MIRTIIFVVLTAIAINHFALCEKNPTAINVRDKAIEVMDDSYDNAIDYIEQVTN